MPAVLFILILSKTPPVRRNVAATGAVVVKVPAPLRRLRRLRLNLVHTLLQAALVRTDLHHVLRQQPDLTFETAQARTQLAREDDQLTFDSVEPHEHLLPHGAGVLQAPVNFVFKRRETSLKIGDSILYAVEPRVDGVEAGENQSHAVLRQILSRFFTHAGIIPPGGRAFKVFRG